MGHDFQPWKWRPFFGLCRYRKIGRFREVRQFLWSFFQSASVFAGVFAIWRRFERTPALPEPRNLSQRPLAITIVCLNCRIFGPMGRRGPLLQKKNRALQKPNRPWPDGVPAGSCARVPARPGGQEAPGRWGDHPAPLPPLYRGGSAWAKLLRVVL